MPVEDRMGQLRESVVNTQDVRGAIVKARYIEETPVELAKAMSIMGGWMFLWTGALLLLILI